MELTQAQLQDTPKTSLPNCLYSCGVLVELRCDFLYIYATVPGSLGTIQEKE